MVKVPINDPKHWRDRAEEARTVADEISDPDAKRKMLRIADWPDAPRNGCSQQAKFESKPVRSVGELLV
jgi:hypothetical protein